MHRAFAAPIVRRHLALVRSNCSSTPCSRLSVAARASSSSSASEQHQAASAVPVPMCRREPTHAGALQELLAWRSGVMERIEALGPSIAADKDGPSVDELRREVGWALEDAVAAYRATPDRPWLELGWRELEVEVRSSRGGAAAASPSAQVLLRASVAELAELWRRRLEERVPFQYLLASAHWRSLVLAVGPGVLVPRPETEALVELAAAALAASPRLASAPWADLGTGSGAIAIELAHQLRAARAKEADLATGPAAAAAEETTPHPPLVYAVDLSATAAAYARANADAAGVGADVAVLQGSWYEPLLLHATSSPQGGGQKQRLLLGGVISNPPYIPRCEMADLQAEVGRHEPAGALDGGAGEGLESLRPICAGAAAALLPGGLLALETAGAAQAALVAALLREQGGAFENVRVVEDCFGVERFVAAERSSGRNG